MIVFTVNYTPAEYVFGSELEDIFSTRESAIQRAEKVLQRDGIRDVSVEARSITENGSKFVGKIFYRQKNG